MEYPQPVLQTDDYVANLRSLVPPPHALQRKGYILSQLSSAELDKKRRCERCCKALTNRDRLLSESRNKPPIVKLPPLPKSQDTGPPDPKELTEEQINKEIAEATRQLSYIPPPSEEEQKRKSKAKAPPPPCRYHPGKIAYGKWSCCQKHIASQPCCNDTVHAPRQYDDDELKNNWLFFETPYKQNKPRGAVAVAIDCEMGVSEAGESELIRVSVVDYFTGAILLDKLVYPDVKMKHYNTRYSGVSFRDMQTAVRKRTCLFGRAAARKAVWNCVGVDTIVVGHDAQSDLTSLRWIHPLVVDTFMVEEEIAREIKDKLTREANKRQEELDLKRLEAVARGEEPPPAAQSEEAAEIERRIKTEFGLSLKFLAKKRLDRTIQIKNQGHDSVEDALAARDILHWHLTNRVMEPVSY